MDPDRAVVHTEHAADHLGERRLAALTHGRDPGVEVDPAGAVRPERDALVRAELGTAAGEEARAGIPGALDERGEPDTGQPTVGRGQPPGSAVLVPADGVRSHPEAQLVVPAVVHRAGGVLPGELALLD